MRQQLLRTLRRSQRPASQANAIRNLSSSARRAAEVELTIDGKKVSIEGTNTLENTLGYRADTDTLPQPAPLSSRPVKRLAPSFPATATTRNL